MKIVLAGQLDRVYSNTLARIEDDADEGWREHVDPAQFEKDRLLFHRAGTLAALSGTVVTAPNWYPVDDADEEGSPAAACRDPSFAPGMLLTDDMWAALYDDAAGLVKAVDFLDGYSKPSLLALDEIDAPDAWIDDDSPRSLQRATVGATHAYLTDLLLQPFLAWHAGAVLVIEKADCHLLADIARLLVADARPRPFPIPDLRNVAAPDAAGATGKVINLGLEDLASIEAERQNPPIQSYARQLCSIVEAPEAPDVNERLARALGAARSSGARSGPAVNDIEVIVEQVEILSNATLRVASHKTDLARLARRNFTAQKLRLLVLV
ncbi:hypothetical protein [Methylobacterium brachiatum]|uniref:hypothetical protein n=1 Tax=Methylobacterium brachiatum TaxID=269660 RepID=UPI000EFAB4CC|nr:hypothetical protein [Methylobacterium brachiatum]AYO81032.1 hypothetical protein EBB05_01150 [Methylobacterium brachiatum]